MSVMTATPTEANEATTPEDRTPDDLWHIAADEFNETRADSGHPWRTLCGQMRPQSREARYLWELAPMERCAICTDLADEADR